MFATLPLEQVIEAEKGAGPLQALGELREEAETLGAWARGNADYFAQVHSQWFAAAEETERTQTLLVMFANTGMYTLTRGANNRVEDILRNMPPRAASYVARITLV